jgi:MarR family transcriptional regulator, 2-MHQ and catechol-resistance regulon repressor
MPRTASLDDPLVTTFGRLLEATHRLEDRLGRELEARHDLPLTWFEVLLRLSRSDEGLLTMGELSEQLTLTTGGVTRLVDRMAAAGHVERRPCPTDRRVLYAGITAAGRAALAPALSDHAAALREVFDGFSSADLARLDSLLDRLRGPG